MAERLYRSVMRGILADIADDAFAAEGALPSENEVAKSYGVSRGVARESIRALEERGVLAVTHGRGQAIEPEGRWSLADGDVLLTLAQLGARPSLVADAIGARVIVAVPAARRAAGSSTAADALREAYGAIERNPGSRPRRRNTDDRAVDAEVAFDRALMSWVGNPVAAAMVDSLHRPIAMLRHELLPERSAAAVKLAARIVDAVAAGDADAAEAAIRNQAAQLTKWFQSYAG